MAEEKKSIGDFSLPNTGVLVIVLSLIGLFLIGPSAFVDERPNAPEGNDINPGYAQDIDARLWQDPFAAVRKDLAKTSTKIPGLVMSRKTPSTFEVGIAQQAGTDGVAKHSPGQPYLHWDASDSGQPITIIAAMVPAGPYSEQQEMRIRTRYALVSALSTLRFKPSDPEHIGYFKPDRGQDLSLPEAVPFEWFDPSEHASAGSCESDNSFRCNKVLVLWIDESRFFEKPVEKIANIFNQVSPSQNNITATPHYVVIGPNDSGQLRAMVKETSHPFGQTGSVKPEHIQFYSAAATAEAAWILEGLRTDNQTAIESCIKDKRNRGQSDRNRSITEQCLVDTLFKNKHIKFVRTIADDKIVAEKLVDELRLRGVDVSKGDHVALLSEWDTLYGRTLPLTFAAAYTHAALRPIEGDRWNAPLPQDTNADDSFPRCESYLTFNSSTPMVHCFSYERGIDGKVPGSSQKEETKSDSQTKSGEKSPSELYDHPDGLSQKDYLRRMVEQIRELDRKLIQNSNGCFNPSRRCGVSAIGVMGYEVYDKLAILQALRSYFPGKLFFTIGNDALYSSPKEYQFTHNLIVASSFGLSLRPEIQHNIPPFRDSYQTSFFLATLLAIVDDQTRSDAGKNESLARRLEDWLEQPRVFEIGHKGPVNISENKNDIRSDEAAARCSRSLLECENIHPPSVWAHPRSYELGLRLIFVILAIVLLYRISWTFREMVLRTGSTILSAIRNRSSKWLTILLIASIPIIGLIIIWSYGSANEEPWLWADGVSIWPAEIFRLAALAASILFTLNLRKKTRESTIELVKKYRLFIDKRRSCVPLSLSLRSVYGWEPPRLDDGKVNVKALWEEYRTRNVLSACLTRSSVNLLVFVAFSYVAILLSGGLPIPARGAFAFNVDKIVGTAAGISILLLTMLVVDTARLGDRLIKHLNGDGTPSDWPCAAKFAREWGFTSDKYVVYWIDVRFVADLTETLGKFIWYPIICLLLMVAARSSVFDDSTFSYGLVTCLAALLLYLFSCAFLLQNGARKMRDKAIGELNRQLRILRGKNMGDKEIPLLQKMIKEIEGIEKGAFTPFMQQPPVRAILAILGGGSGIPLLDRFF